MSKTTPRRDLTIDKIVDSASDIVRREGSNALTMRRLAAACGVTPMALYHHVEDKDEVLEKVLDQVIGEILAVELQGDPSERLLGFCMAMYSVMVSNPGVGRLWVSRGVTVPNMSLTTERAFQLLVESGLEGEQLTAALDCLVVFIVGGVAYNLSRPAGIRYELLDGADSQATPLLTDLIKGYAERDPDAQFRRGLEALWKGLSASTRSAGH